MPKYKRPNMNGILYVKRSNLHVHNRSLSVIWFKRYYWINKEHMDLRCSSRSLNKLNTCEIT